MAITVYPTTVQDNWIQIATTTPTSGSAVSFTSIPGTYRKLWLVTGGDPIALTASATIDVTVNSLTAVNTYTFNCFQSNSSNRYSDETSISQAVNTSTAISFDLTFVNKTSGTPSATFTGNTGAGTSGRTILSGRIPSLTTPITQMDLTLSANAISGANTGQITLYGTF